MTTSTAVVVASAAADGVRELNHLTLHQDALRGPADLDRLVAELAMIAARLPQLLGQLRRWLDAEHAAGRVRSDSSIAPGVIVSAAVLDLAAATEAAAGLGVVLDAAHQRLARLGATDCGPGLPTACECDGRLAGRDG